MQYCKLISVSKPLDCLGRFA